MVQIRFNHQQGYHAETMEQCVKLDHRTVGQQQKSSKCRYCIWLVVEPPLWKIWVRQLEWWLFPICGKIKIVPNHQPGIYMWYIYSLSLQFPYHVWSLNMSRSWLVVFFFWARHDPLDIAEWFPVVEPCYSGMCRPNQWHKEKTHLFLYFFVDRNFPDSQVSQG